MSHRMNRVGTNFYDEGTSRLIEWRACVAGKKHHISSPFNLYNKLTMTIPKPRAFEGTLAWLYRHNANKWWLPYETKQDRERFWVRIDSGVIRRGLKRRSRPGRGGPVLSSWRSEKERERERPEGAGQRISFVSNTQGIRFFPVSRIRVKIIKVAGGKSRGRAR